MAELKLHVDASELDAAIAKAKELSEMLDGIEARFATIDLRLVGGVEPEALIPSPRTQNARSLG